MAHDGRPELEIDSELTEEQRATLQQEAIGLAEISTRALTGEQDARLAAINAALRGHPAAF